MQIQKQYVISNQINKNSATNRRPMTRTPIDVRRFEREPCNVVPQAMQRSAEFLGHQNKSVRCKRAWLHRFSALEAAPTSHPT